MKSKKISLVRCTIQNIDINDIEVRNLLIYKNVIHKRYNLCVCVFFFGSIYNVQLFVRAVVMLLFFYYYLNDTMTSQ